MKLFYDFYKDINISKAALKEIWVHITDLTCITKMYKLYE